MSKFYNSKNCLLYSFFISVLILLIFAKPIFAEDYVYKGTEAYHTCVNSHTKCTEAKKYINEGINYYSNKTYDYVNLRNYCSLLYLRVASQSFGNVEQWNKDILDLNRRCSF